MILNLRCSSSVLLSCIGSGVWPTHLQLLNFSFLVLWKPILINKNALNHRITIVIGQSHHLFLNYQWAQPKFEPRISGVEFHCSTLELTCHLNVVQNFKQCPSTKVIIKHKQQVQARTRHISTKRAKAQIHHLRSRGSIEHSSFHISILSINKTF